MSSTNKTTNLHLNQWVSTDPVLMADFNADNLALDAAVASLQNTRLKFATGTYMGTGLAGPSFPTSYTFSFQPRMLVLTDTTDYSASNTDTNCLGIWLFGVPSGLSYCNGNQVYNVSVTWTNNTVSWYYKESGSENAKYQFNTSGQTYRFLAIG